MISSSKCEIFFYYLLQGSLDPQNYEFAPQIPENNYKCSPAPWK